MALTKSSVGGSGEPSFNPNPNHSDEVVVPVREVPSKLIAEAQLRHENAENGLATPQERKQAAVEQAHALSTRPDGSYAQLHEAAEPTLAVADKAHLTQLRDDQDQAVAKLQGETDDVPASVVGDTSGDAKPVDKLAAGKVDKAK